MSAGAPKIPAKIKQKKHDNSVLAIAEKKAAADLKKLQEEEKPIKLQHINLTKASATRPNRRPPTRRPMVERTTNLQLKPESEVVSLVANKKEDTVKEVDEDHKKKEIEAIEREKRKSSLQSVGKKNVMRIFLDNNGIGFKTVAVPSPCNMYQLCDIMRKKVIPSDSTGFGIWEVRDKNDVRLINPEEEVEEIVHGWKEDILFKFVFKKALGECAKLYYNNQSSTSTANKNPQINLASLPPVTTSPTSTATTTTTTNTSATTTTTTTTPTTITTGGAGMVPGIAPVKPPKPEPVRSTNTSGSAIAGNNGANRNNSGSNIIISNAKEPTTTTTSSSVNNGTTTAATTTPLVGSNNNSPIGVSKPEGRRPAPGLQTGSNSNLTNNNNGNTNANNNNNNNSGSNLNASQGAGVGDGKGRRPAPGLASPGNGARRPAPGMSRGGSGIRTLNGSGEPGSGIRPNRPPPTRANTDDSSSSSTTTATIAVPTSVEPPPTAGSAPVASPASNMPTPVSKSLSEPAYKSKNVVEWTIEEVGEWICELGFEKMRECFVENYISGAELVDLQNDELKDDLGVTALGARKAILREIQNLKNAC